MINVGSEVMAAQIKSEKKISVGDKGGSQHWWWIKDGLELLLATGAAHRGKYPKTT